MSIPVNLYVDRMSPTQPVRTADIAAAISDRSSAYQEAAAKIGLTAGEYADFRQALNDGHAIYVRLPRRIDGMAGIHRRNHAVYALHNVLVPRETMGWQINLADGTQVLIPQICGNLSMNHPRVSAKPKAHPALSARPVAREARAQQPKAVRAAHYVALAPAAVTPTAVSFDVPPVVAIGGGSSSGSAPIAIAAATAPSRFGGYPFVAAALVPFIGAFGGGNHSSSAPANAANVPEVAPCSAGSNALGVCRQ